jgi:hypothetical protein
VPPDTQSIVAPDRAHRRKHDPVGVDEAARRPAPALDLNDRRRDGINGIGHVSRKFVQHVAILADAAIAIITRTGRLSRTPNFQLPTSKST